MHRNNAGVSVSSPFLSCTQFRCISWPEAIKSHSDKVQHQKKIMRQIWGFKNERKTKEERMNSNKKQDILFMLGDAVMQKFACSQTGLTSPVATKAASCPHLHMLSFLYSSIKACAFKQNK